MHNPPEAPDRSSGVLNSPPLAAAGGRGLHDLVWAQAEARPDAVAVWTQRGELTYAALRRRALAIAAQLREAGVGVGDRVGLAVERGPDLVPALLGIISSGAAWVGLDLGLPSARLRWLLDDAQPSALVTDGAGDALLRSSGLPSIRADRVRPGPATPNGVPGASAGDVATLVYTSGSTGEPKGALLTHAGLVNLVEGWAREPGLGAGDTVLGLSSVAFDMSILDVFLPLAVGARLVLVDRDTVRDGEALARLAERCAATFILATPSTWRLLLAGSFRPPGRLVGVAGGEVLTPELVSSLLALGVALFNGYGVTEASACSCLWRVTEGRRPVPVGRPSPGVRVEVLDPLEKPVGDGEIGELWIAGVGVAAGYHRRPELTAQRFASDPSAAGGWRYRTGDRARWEPDGVLTLHGRDDDQVKVRGHRVELGEVEAALLACSHVAEACAVATEAFGGDAALAAFVVTTPGAPPDIEADIEARTLNELAATLPEAFIPARIHRVACLPRNSSGKVDRGALRALSGARPASLGPVVPAAAGLEARIAALVADLLGVAEVGATDRFVALGGASLAATRLVRRLRDDLGLAVPLVRVLQDGSPRTLLAEATQTPAEVDVETDALPPRSGGHALSAEQAQLWFIDTLAPGVTAYHTAFEVALEGPLDAEAMARAWALLIARHEVLRSRWLSESGRPVQRLASGEARPLAFHDVAGRPAGERSAVVADIRRAIQRTPFDLADGHVVRGSLLRLGPDVHRLVACAHHIAFDGASLAVLQADLAALYAQAAGLAEGPRPLAFQAAELAPRDAQDVAETLALTAFWRERLRDLPAKQALPGAVPTIGPRSEAALAWPLTFGASTAEGVASLARAANATPFAVMLAALAAQLRTETGQGDLVVGTLLSGRERPGAAELIGHLAQSVVLRIDASGEPNFRAFTERTRDALLEGMAHADLPFDRVVAALGPERQRDQQPIFQTVFVWQDPPFARSPVGDLSVQVSEAFHGAAPFDLLVQCWPADGGFSGSLLHRTDRLPPSVGEALARRFEATVARLVADPDGLAFTHSVADVAAARLLCDRLEILDAVVGPRPRPDGTVERVAWVVTDAADATDIAAEITAIAAGAQTQVVARIPLLPNGLPDRALLAAPREAGLPRRPALHLDDLLGPASLTQPSAPPAKSPVSSAAAPVAASAPPTHASRPSLREGPPLVMPAGAPADLPSVLRRAAERAPDRGVQHLESDGSERFVSWPELLGQAQSVAAALQQVGLGPGDPVILVSDRSADFLAGLWGAFFAGVVPVPLAPAPHWDPATGAAQRLLGVHGMLDAPPILAGGAVTAALDTARAAMGLGAARLLCIADLARTAAFPVPVPVALGPDSPAIFLLTSGSTGVPKAVTHVQSTVLALLQAYGTRHALGPDDVFLNWLGLDHVAPLFMVHLSAVWHAASHVNAPASRFSADPAAALDWASRFGATTTFVANFAFGLMADAAADVPVGRWDLRRFRLLTNGGESIVARTARRFLTTLAPHGLPAQAMVPIWGMSETGSATITALDFTLENTDDTDPFVPIGDPISGFAMRVVDEAGVLLPEGAIGRLHVRGAQLHRGYHRRPDADRESFTEDGWFDTGDLAFIDARGMSIAGRAKDLIIIHGVNVYAHDIEAAVEAVPGVAPSFVAACPLRPPGADTDELAIFFVPEVADEGALPGLCAQIRGAVSRSAGVGVGTLLPVDRASIPKTEIGKVQRTRLRQRLEAGEFDALHRRVERVCHGRRTTPDWFFEPVWRSRPSTPAAEGPTEVLVVGRAGAPPSTLGSAAVRHIEAHDADAVAAAARAFLAGARERPAIVLGAPGGPEPESPDDQLAYALRRASLLVAIASAMEAAPPSVRARLLVETRLAVPAFEGEGGAVAEAPLLGLLASLRHEQPLSRVTHVDHDADSPDAAWEILASELAAQPRGDLDVVVRGERRYVRRLARPAFPAAPPADEAPRRWLLTGGLGGVGQVLAERLLDDPTTRLLIVGRTPEPELAPDAAAALNRLRSRGDVAYAAVDIADAGALAAAVEAQEGAWGGPLQAVAHLAAVMESCLVARLGPVDLLTALRPRLLGTLASASLLDDRPGAWFFDHTSVNALFGGFGAGAYAAGCRVGASVVAGLRARGRRATSLSWSLWEDRGVTRGLPVEGLALRRGYLPIDARRGADAMSIAIRHTPAAWLVGLDDRAPPIRRLLDEGPIALHDQASAANAPSAGPASAGQGGQARDACERRLAAIWRDLLGVHELGIDDSFFDLGGHSLLLAKLQARVEAEFQRITPMMVLFEQPTIRRQAAWLSADGSGPAPVTDATSRDRATRARQALSRPRPTRRN